MLCSEFSFSFVAMPYRVFLAAQCFVVLAGGARNEVATLVSMQSPGDGVNVQQIQQSEQQQFVDALNNGKSIEQVRRALVKSREALFSKHEKARGANEQAATLTDEQGASIYEKVAFRSAELTRKKEAKKAAEDTKANATTVQMDLVAQVAGESSSPLNSHHSVTPIPLLAVANSLVKNGVTEANKSLEATASSTNMETDKTQKSWLKALGGGYVLAALVAFTALLGGLFVGLCCFGFAAPRRAVSFGGENDGTTDHASSASSGDPAPVDLSGRWLAQGKPRGVSGTSMLEATDSYTHDMMASMCTGSFDLSKSTQQHSSMLD